MIRYALRCEQDHAFDGWFRSADGFEVQLKGGQLTCPECGSYHVVKALMAPSVAPAAAAPPVPALTTPANPREAALAELRRKIEENSEYVGMNFAAEARAIHDGDAPERAIYGEARLEEARALIEEGIPVAPLPFMPAGKVN